MTLLRHLLLSLLFLTALRAPLAATAAEHSPEYRYMLGLAAIFQNDAPYLREWIEFHRLVGVEHFWLYNNNSGDDYLEVLAPYLAEGIIELIPWGTGQDDWDGFCFNTQPAAYRDAIERARSSTQHTKWLAIIDTDEFIFPVQHKKLLDCLEESFSDCSGICVNWQLYGTSQVSKVPPGRLMIETLLYKAPTHYTRNTHYKSIVQPSHVLWCDNPHLCHYQPGHWHVNTNRERLDMNNDQVLVDKIRINHYWTRDEDYMYNIKVPRYDKWANNGSLVLAVIAELNQVYDATILKYAKELRERLRGQLSAPVAP